MKTLFVIFCLVCLAGIAWVFSCSEKSRAAVRVLHDKAENQLVSVAGEGEVALRLMKNQYASDEERLVAIKTLKRSMERRAVECESTAAPLIHRAKPTPPFANANLPSNTAGTWTLAVKEIQAEETLKSFSTEYENLRSEVTLLNEQIAATEAMGGTSTGKGIDNPDKERMEHVKTLVEQLKTKLDRAKAITETNELEGQL